MTSTEIATTAPNGLATTGMFGGNLDSRDIMLPIIALRQNSYKQDYMEDFNPGDLIKRPDNVLLAKKGEDVLFVPISIEKIWRIVDVTSASDIRTIGSEPFAQANRDAVLEWETSECKYRRDACWNVHILLLEDLKAQASMMKDLKEGKPVDPDDFTLPARLSFYRSGFQGGKLLNTHFEMCRALNNQSPATKVFALRSTPKKNDMGNWFVLDVAKVTDAKLKKTPAAMLDAANFWVQNLSKRKVEAFSEEADLVEEVKPAQGLNKDDIPF